VQLANFQGHPERPDWTELRDAQSAALDLPETAQAVAIDLGETHDIHPADKREVGRRMALLALQKTYQHNVVSSGPRFASVAFSGRSATLSFSELGGGLIKNGPELKDFEVAGPDRVFKPAKALIKGDHVVVWSCKVPEPAAVRYAWRNAPEATLFNKANLPASPFRTDSW
jgi:sialate O-acetylesterase